MPTSTKTLRGGSKGATELRRLALLCLVLLLKEGAVSQTEPTNPSLDSGISLRVTTRMVVVDAVVTDKRGNAVTNLGADEFTILEDGKPQKIHLFSQPQSLQTAKQSVGPLPPNVFSNSPEDRQPAGPLVLLLLDSLNSQFVDQMYARRELLKDLVQQASARRRIAIFGLSNKLLLIQDFTSDPDVLAAAVAKLVPQKSVASSRGEAFTITPQMAAGMPESLLNSLKTLNQEQAVNSIDDRVRITLASLNAIARAMMGYRGRKNLVWVSAAFPVYLAMEGKYANLSRNYQSEVRETATLLSQAQVAVYPVDSRGLTGIRRTTETDELVPTVVSAGDSAAGEDPLINAAPIEDASHMAMQQLASETSGKAFYNANDLDRAVLSGMADGTSYYALGYYPENRKWDGKYRKIQLKVRRKGLATRYRRGYYSFESPSAINRPELNATGKHIGEIEIAASDPLPATGVTFRAQVVPSNLGGGDTKINLVIDSTTIALTESSPDRYKSDLDIAAFLMLPDGTSTIQAHQNLVSLLPQKQYVDVRQHGLPVSLRLNTLPSPGDLRLVIRDNVTGLIGSLSIPLTRSSRVEVQH